jgi:RNA polymerase sigma factor (sigma-70 family)
MREFSHEVERAEGDMTERLGRRPTAGELAARLEVPEERVIEAQGLEECRRPLSLDREQRPDDTERSSCLEQVLGGDDRELLRAEHRVGMNQALRHLSPPLREVIQLRYFSELSQRAVGRRLGLSQMQVSRMEKRALDQLRGEFAVA